MQNKKIRVSWKIKIQLATASAAATLYQRCHYTWARCASFMALFRNPDALDPRLCLARICPVVIEEDTRRAVARHRSEIWLSVSTAWQISRGPATSSTRGVWNVLYHILSRAEEEVMTECDIHHTRAIKTNSAVNLSRKLGLDLCCDLLQHLQGYHAPVVFTLSYVNRFCSSHHHSNCLSYEM